MKAARNSASQRGRIALVIGASGHSTNNSARGHLHRQRRLMAEALCHYRAHLPCSSRSWWTDKSMSGPPHPDDPILIDCDIF